MRWITVLLIIVTLFLGVLGYSYLKNQDSNGFNIKDIKINLTQNKTGLQFYKNLRFSNSNISYRIDENCSDDKKESMTKAFSAVQDITILSFFKADKNEEIYIYCDEEKVPERGLFVAGEGGPANITAGDSFNIITYGEILLMQKQECEYPNVAIHELLHVLGFEHVNDTNDILYPVSTCEQTIGENIIKEINRLYSYESYPDLEFLEVEVSMDGIYLNLNVSIKNNGIVDAPKSKIVVYGNSEILEEILLEEIKVSHSVKIKVSNIFIKKFKIEELKILLETDFNELSKENNEILLS